MANGTTSYNATVHLPEDDLLLLIKTADALEEIGATVQAEVIRKVTQQFTRTR